MDPEELNTRFEAHEVDADQAASMAAIREKAGDLADLIVATTPASREQSLAITKAEEAMFWANAAIARREVA